MPMDKDVPLYDSYGYDRLRIFFSNFIYLFYFWLCWVFVSVRGLSLVLASGGPSSSRCAGLSLSRPLLLRSTGSRRAGSVIVAHGPSCSVACGILPDQDSNPCALHWQADSQPLRHQGSPRLRILKRNWMRVDKEHADLSMYTNIYSFCHTQLFSLERHNCSLLQLISELKSKEKIPLSLVLGSLFFFFFFYLIN